MITLLREVWDGAGLGLAVEPYGVLPTKYECGIIQVVPNCTSRAGLGETADGGLYEIFCRDFGSPGSAPFEAARENFVRTAAGCGPLLRVFGTGLSRLAV